MHMTKKKRRPEDVAFGKRLRHAREGARLTRSQLADELTARGHTNKNGEPMGGSTIGNWELGIRTPSLRNIGLLKDISEICGTFVSVLLDLPEAPVDRRHGQVSIAYRKTDERGRDAIWRVAESQPEDEIDRFSSRKG